jgi:hypothetical protein
MRKIFALPPSPEQKKRAMCFLMYDGVGTFFGSQRGLKARGFENAHSAFGVRALLLTLFDYSAAAEESSKI